MEEGNRGMLLNGVRNLRTMDSFFLTILKVVISVSVEQKQWYLMVTQTALQKNVKPICIKLMFTIHNLHRNESTYAHFSVFMHFLFNRTFPEKIRKCLAQRSLCCHPSIGNDVLLAVVKNRLIIIGGCRAKHASLNIFACTIEVGS